MSVMCAWSGCCVVVVCLLLSLLLLRLLLLLRCCFVADHFFLILPASNGNSVTQQLDQKKAMTMMRPLLVGGAFVIAAFAATPCVATDISMDDDAILYSPFNWQVTPQHSAKTINPGAYFRVIFSGQSAVLHTNTTASASGNGPYSQFWTRVDGGPLQQHVLQPGVGDYTVQLGPPFSASPNHLLEVVVKSTSETIDRWNQQVC